MRKLLPAKPSSSGWAISLRRCKATFLFGSEISAADCYLFVMLLWARKNGLEPPAKLAAFRDKMTQRPAVQKAMKNEGAHLGPSRTQHWQRRRCSARSAP